MRTLKLVSSRFCIALCLQIGCAIPAIASEGAGKFFSENSSNVNDSFRLTFELKTPRRFATRFVEASRILEVRITPANMREFETISFYDPRYIRRTMTKEEAGEVILSFQLVNAAISWFVSFQENPWRIFIDFWDFDPASRKNLQEEWNWQDERLSNNFTNNEGKQNLPPVPRQSAQIEFASENDMPQVSEPPLKNNVKIAKNKTEILENFNTLEELDPKQKEKLASIQQRVGEEIGTSKEFEVNMELAKVLFYTGQFEAAMNLYRRMAVTFAERFENNVEFLWYAGESAYLAEKHNIAKDYFRTVLLKYPKNEIASQAELRLLDIDFLEKRKAKNEPLENFSEKYAAIAMKETASWRAKIAAAVRILHNIIDNQPNSAINYQHILNTCVNKFIVPFEIRKNCAYIKTRSLIEKQGINDADMEIQTFKKISPNDMRTAKLENMIADRVKNFLLESSQKKNWNQWIEFEKEARPELVNYVSNNPDYLFMRAEAWDAIGDQKNASKLFALCWDKTANEVQKIEAGSMVASTLRKQKQNAQSEKYLRSIEKDDFRKRQGLSPLALKEVRELALSPYRSKTALDLMIDEIDKNRFVEKELVALIDYVASLGNSKSVEIVIDKLVAFPAKDVNEFKKIENIVMKHADNLSKNGKNERSAELFAALVKLPLATRRAEAAYRAGIAYFRIGQLEKAKSSWQSAAGDLTDRRFSALANERLDRIR